MSLINKEDMVKVCDEIQKTSFDSFSWIAADGRLVPVGIVNKLEDAISYFKSDYYNMLVLCIDLPRARYVTNCQEATDFFELGDYPVLELLEQLDQLLKLKPKFPTQPPFLQELFKFAELLIEANKQFHDANNVTEIK